MLRGLGNYLFPLGAISATWPVAIMPMLSRVPQQPCRIRGVITHCYITQDLRLVHVPFYTRYHPLILQQNNAPAQRAKVTQAVQGQSNIQTMLWHVMSTDLNHIENLWGVSKSRLNQLPNRLHNAGALCRETQRPLNRTPNA